MAATFDTTEQRILKIIDDNRETIVEFARDIYDHAELGYKEFRTSKKFVDFMKSLHFKGLPRRSADNHIYTVLPVGNPTHIP